MTNEDELLKNADIQKIAEKGAKIYDHLKIKYEPHNNGKFLAIEVDSESVYLGNSSAEALEFARAKHPQKIFYVVKIGFDVVETMAKSYKETGVEPVGIADGTRVFMPLAPAIAVMEDDVERVDVLISKSNPLAGIGLLSKFGYKAIVDCKHRTVSLEKV